MTVRKLCASPLFRQQFRFFEHPDCESLFRRRSLERDQSEGSLERSVLQDARQSTRKDKEVTGFSRYESRRFSLRIAIANSQKLSCCPQLQSSSSPIHVSTFITAEKRGGLSRETIEAFARTEHPKDNVSSRNRN